MVNVDQTSQREYNLQTKTKQYYVLADLLLAPWRPWPRACRSLALSCVPEPPPHTGTCFTKDED